MKQTCLKRIALYFGIMIGMGAASSLSARQPFPPPAQNQQIPVSAGIGKPEIPELTWFKGENGYKEAQELQKQTGADMFVLFYNLNDKNEKGLFKWMENRGLKTTDVRMLLRNYIKVKIRMNKKATREIAKKDFYVKSTPATYLVWSNGWTRRCQFFDWSGDRPRLKNSEEMAEIIQTNSSSYMQEIISAR